MTHDAIWAMAALAGVLWLIWLARRATRASSLLGHGAPGRLRLVSGLAIDPKRRLVLLQCDGRDILLLTGGPQDLQLHPCQPPPVVARLS